MLVATPDTALLVPADEPPVVTSGFTTEPTQKPRTAPAPALAAQIPMQMPMQAQAPLAAAQPQLSQMSMMQMQMQGLQGGFSPHATQSFAQGTFRPQSECF